MSCTTNVLYIQFTLSGLIVKFGFLRRCVLKLMSSGCDAVYFGTCNPNYVHCFASVSTVMSKFHHRFTLVGLYKCCEVPLRSVFRHLPVTYCTTVKLFLSSLWPCSPSASHSQHYTRTQSSY